MSGGQMDWKVNKEISNESHEIEARVTCEKTDVSPWFSFEYGSNDELNDILSDPTWVYEGLSQWFWENHWEFEEAIDIAMQFVESESGLSLKQALFRELGLFTISYEIEGNDVIPFFDIDINETMYNLLES